MKLLRYMFIHISYSFKLMFQIMDVLIQFPDSLKTLKIIFKLTHTLYLLCILHGLSSEHLILSAGGLVNRQYDGLIDNHVLSGVFLLYSKIQALLCESTILTHLSHLSSNNIVLFLLLSAS